MTALTRTGKGYSVLYRHTTEHFADSDLRLIPYWILPDMSIGCCCSACCAMLLLCQHSVRWLLHTCVCVAHSSRDSKSVSNTVVLVTCCNCLTAHQMHPTQLVCISLITHANHAWGCMQRLSPKYAIELTMSPCTVYGHADGGHSRKLLAAYRGLQPDMQLSLPSWC